MAIKITSDMISDLKSCSEYRRCRECKAFGACWAKGSEDKLDKLKAKLVNRWVGEALENHHTEIPVSTTPKMSAAYSYVQNSQQKTGKPFYDELAEKYFCDCGEVAETDAYRFSFCPRCGSKFLWNLTPKRINKISAYR